MSSISDGTTTFIPRTVLGWSNRRASRHVLHEIIGRGDPDVTLQVAASRSGELRILCDDYEAALTCETLHAGAAVLSYTSDDLPGTSQTYVVTGEPSLDLDEETLIRSVVVVPFREVTP